MGFSLGRSGNAEYRFYLKSRAWNWRRQHWFATCRAKGYEPACQVCGARLDEAKTLDLHHMSYDGVSRTKSGSWRSDEHDDDLIPLCRQHHQHLHKILDTQSKDFRGWSRSRATIVILANLRRAYLAKKDPHP